MKMKNLISLIFQLGIVPFASAQSFIGKSMALVVHELKSEEVAYHINISEEGIMIVAYETTDTAIWKFDRTNTCIEYLLMLDPIDYFELCSLLLMHHQKITDGIYLNVHDKTVTYVYLEPERLVLRTTAFSYSSNAPHRSTYIRINLSVLQVRPLSSPIFDATPHPGQLP